MIFIAMQIYSLPIKIFSINLFFFLASIAAEKNYCACVYHIITSVPFAWKKKLSLNVNDVHLLITLISCQHLATKMEKSSQ